MNSVREAVERFERCSRTGLAAGGPGFSEVEATALKVAFAAGLKAGADLVHGAIFGEGDAFAEMDRFYQDVEDVMVEATAKVRQMAAARN